MEPACKQVTEKVHGTLYDGYVTSDSKAQARRAALQNFTAPCQVKIEVGTSEPLYNGCGIQLQARPRSPDPQK